MTNLESDAGTTTGWVDTLAAPATVYEYQVRRASDGGREGSGFVLSAIERPLIDARGTLILIVDNRLAAALSNELSVLAADLVGDGWRPRRHDVAGKHWSDPGWKEAVTNVKSLITSDYRADPTGVRAVFLVGHVPVPYSGHLRPDGHENHEGAWPADVYYGDMDGLWSDASVTSLCDRVRQQNVPGDGKFDQSVVPADVRLQVGRVDFYDMACFAGKSETDLLRQYLNKDHHYRMKWITAPPRGLIDDHFGDFGGEAFAANGWRNFGGLFGVSNVVEGGWFGTLSKDSFQWAYGCGGGDVELCGGVGRSADFAAADSQVIFTMLFGSFFGDWDQPNVILRAPLGMPTYTLSCTWGGRPDNLYHHMSLGETLGESVRQTQNHLTSRRRRSRNPDARAGTPRDEGPSRAMVHVALMGDPSLRLHIIAPGSGLHGERTRRRTTLHWTPSPDDGVSGYHVYKSDRAAGPYVRLTDTPVGETTYVDQSRSADGTVYMVRPVRLEISPGGSYWNIGQGVFVTVGGGRPNRLPTAEDQRVSLSEDATLALTLTARDPDGDPLIYTLAQRPQHGTVTGRLPDAVYTPRPDYSGPDSFGFQVSDGRVASATARVVINVTPVNDTPVGEVQQLKLAQNSQLALTLRATDVENTALTYRIDTQPDHGTLLGTPPALTYVPAAGYAGPDRFTFRADDGQTSGVATVAIAVQPFRNPENPANCTVGLAYEEYLGTWSQLPDFDTLKPHTKGVLPGLSLDVRTTNDCFAIRYRGYLRCEVDVHQADTHVVPERPLEIVHQRPVKVPADVGAFGDALREFKQVPVKVIDALWVMDAAIEMDVVEVLMPVLGDDDRPAIASVPPARQPAHHGRCDVPAVLGGRDVTGRRRNSLWPALGIGADELGRVEVQPAEGERLRTGRQDLRVARPQAWRVEAERGFQWRTRSPNVRAQRAA